MKISNVFNTLDTTCPTNEVIKLSKGRVITVRAVSASSILIASPVPFHFSGGGKCDYCSNGDSEVFESQVHFEFQESGELEMSEQQTVRPVVAELFKGVISEHPILGVHDKSSIIGLSLCFRDGTHLDVYSQIAIEQAKALAKEGVESEY